MPLPAGCPATGIFGQVAAFADLPSSGNVCPSAGPIRAATGAECQAETSPGSDPRKEVGVARATTTTRRFGKAAVAAVTVAAALTAGNVLIDLGCLRVERVSVALAAVEAPAPLANSYTQGRFVLELDG
jgi:hypothetical protein